jgi:hypothetical protein
MLLADFAHGPCRNFAAIGLGGRRRAAPDTALPERIAKI